MLRSAQHDIPNGVKNLQISTLRIVRPSIEDEGDRHVSIAVRDSVVLFEIRRGELAAPDDVVIAMVR